MATFISLINGPGPAVLQPRLARTLLLFPRRSSPSPSALVLLLPRPRLLLQLLSYFCCLAHSNGFPLSQEPTFSYRYYFFILRLHNILEPHIVVASRFYLLSSSLSLCSLSHSLAAVSLTVFPSSQQCLSLCYLALPVLF